MMVMRIPKRDQAVNNVENPTSNLPGESDNWPIKIKTVKLAASGRPVKSEKNREKLFLRVGRSKNHRQQVQIGRLGSDVGGWGKLVRVR